MRKNPEMDITISPASSVDLEKVKGLRCNLIYAEIITTIACHWANEPLPERKNYLVLRKLMHVVFSFNNSTVRDSQDK